MHQILALLWQYLVSPLIFLSLDIHLDPLYSGAYDFKHHCRPPSVSVPQKLIDAKNITELEKHASVMRYTGYGRYGCDSPWSLVDLLYLVLLC